MGSIKQFEMEGLICKRNRFIVNMIAWNIKKVSINAHLKKEKNILKLKSIVESMQFSPEGRPLYYLYPKSFILFLDEHL